VVAMAAMPSDRTYISDLPEGTDEATVKAIFGAYGNIKTCISFPAKRAAMIQFQSVEEATWVVENLHSNIAQGLTTPVSCEFMQAPGQKATAKGNRKGGEICGAPSEEKGASKQSQRWEPYTHSGRGLDGGKSARGDADGGGQKSWEQKGSWDSGKGYSGKRGGVKALKKGLFESGVLPGWSNDEGAIYISGLPADTTDLDLYEIFAPFGPIPFKGVRAMMKEGGQCKGYGFVNFLTAEAARNAIQSLDRTLLADGSSLRVMTKGPAGPAKGKSKGKSEQQGHGK